MRPRARSWTTPQADLASVRARVFGQLVDSALAVGVVTIAVIPSAFSATPGRVTATIGCILALAYILFSDGLQQGQSYGKRMAQIAVIDASTYRPCSFAQSFVRNLLLCVLGVIDWVWILGEKRQRLGDKIANTLVIAAHPEAELRCPPSRAARLSFEK